MTAAEREFAETHLGLAQQQARRFAIRHQLDFEEVLGAAYEGLCKAAVGFDASLGYRRALRCAFPIATESSG